MVVNEGASPVCEAVRSEASNGPHCDNMLTLRVFCANSANREVERSVCSLLRADVRNRRFRSGANISNSYARMISLLLYLTFPGIDTGCMMSMASSDGVERIFRALLPSPMDDGRSAEYVVSLRRRLAADLGRRCGGSVPRIRVAFQTQPSGDPCGTVLMLRDGVRRLRRRNPLDSTQFRMLKL